jgi:hypothetical protein
VYIIIAAFFFLLHNVPFLSQLIFKTVRHFCPTLYGGMFHTVDEQIVTDIMEEHSAVTFRVKHPM